MTAPQAGTLPVWHDEGRRIASALDAVGSALVIGRDPEIAAWVALGAAREQAATRRVAVADLVGEVAPIQALIGADDDPHGISDSFLYGVSLNRIARPADDGGNLFLLPSGSEAVAVEEIFRSDRWRRLASGFREVGALLLLVAHADTPGLEQLAASVDGVVLAGDAYGALPDAAPPLAVVGAPRRGRPAGRGAAGAPALATAGGGDATGGPAEHALGEPTPGELEGGRRAPRPPRVAEPAAPPRPVSKVLVGAITLALVAAGGWLAVRGLPKEDAPNGTSASGAGGATGAATGDSVTRLAAARDSAVRDSVRRDSLVRDAARRDSIAAANAPVTLPSLTLANPGDSAAALQWSVWAVSGNTPEAAALDPRVDLATLPVRALTPVLERGAPWYRLLVGAFATQQQAESLLVDLRRRKVLGAGSGSVVRAPYALRVADSLQATRAPARVDALARQGVPAYVVSRGDGTVAVYAGAFDSPAQAALLARTLQTAGVAPVLVFRTGRGP